MELSKFKINQANAYLISNLITSFYFYVKKKWRIEISDTHVLFNNFRASVTSFYLVILHEIPAAPASVPESYTNKSS